MDRMDSFDVKALYLTVIHISTVVVQLFLPINILGPVELLVGTVIMLKSTFITPRKPSCHWKVLQLLATILLFILFLVFIPCNPASPIQALPNVEGGLCPFFFFSW